MDLVQIDIVGAQAAERRVDRRQHVLARQPSIVRSWPHRVEHLGGDDDVVAAGEVPDGAAGDLLGDAERIHVGGVDEVDAELDRTLDDRPAAIFGEHPRAPAGVAVGHHAEADPRHFEACAA
jgi:hypothetical protein